MKIKLDNREHELLKHIKDLIIKNEPFKNLEVLVDNLPLGDVIISNDIENKLIIERKSISDLASSIKDGRYEEQSYRLNNLNHPNHNIMYLIEGDLNKPLYFKNNLDKYSLNSAIVSLNYYKGFSVIRTFSIIETAFFICNTANKLKKGEIANKLPYYQNKLNENITTPITGKNTENNENNEINDKEYIGLTKKVKKDNITPENICEIMLCQIPGISSVTAIAIMNKFKTLPNLLTEIQKDANCLKDISYTNAKNQTRKINKNSSANIIKFLINK